MDKYEKIVWALRECSGDESDNVQICDCDSCPYKEYIDADNGYMDYTKCGDKACRDAADAIEELCRINRELEIVVENLEHRNKSSYKHGKSKGFKIGRAYESNKKWIPCSERLPKMAGHYLVTTYDVDGYLDTDMCYWEDVDTDDNYGFCLVASDVLAWMELPLPWGKKGESK